MEIETQVELTPHFVKKAYLPFEAVIDNVTPVKGKYGKDYRITLVTPEGFKEFDVWGTNLYVISEAYGKDYSKWIGKSIYLYLNEKGYKVLSCVLTGSTNTDHEIL